MLSDFPNPDSLPGGLKTGPPSDTTTYYNIWRVGEDLVERCVKARGEVGWQATGEILRYTLSLEIFASIHFFWGFLVYISLACAFRLEKEPTADIWIPVFAWQIGARFGIGVFIWATGSQEDNFIEADEPRFVFPVSEAPDNTSVAVV